MTNKLRIVQIDREEIVIKAATDKVINDVKKAMTAGVVVTVEKKGWIYHLAGQHIVRLEIEPEEEKEEDQG